MGVERWWELIMHDVGVRERKREVEEREVEEREGWREGWREGEGEREREREGDGGVRGIKK